MPFDDILRTYRYTHARTHIHTPAGFVPKSWAVSAFNSCHNVNISDKCLNCVMSLRHITTLK